MTSPGALTPADGGSCTESDGVLARGKDHGGGDLQVDGGDHQVNLEKLDSSLLDSSMNLNSYSNFERIFNVTPSRAGPGPARGEPES